ncbi:Exc2 family lipoprotein, partial [Klebsiella pneumoniae]|uniref:Exc2 family lipoprotein n=1 Tax=Klebsiella pneumoniae TaxID=573 RepID=UPI000671F83A
MRRSGSKLCLIAMITATATLTACAPKGSVEQHTRHYVYASDDGFDPNFSTQKADTTRMMVPFFRQFWDMGAKDKATGKSRSDVQQRIQQFRGLTLSGTKTHVKQRFLPLTPLLMVSDDLWSP